MKSRFALLALISVFAPHSLLAQTQQVEFGFVGHAQTWVVPDNVTSVTVDARGAQGGGNPVELSAAGGKGGRVQTTLAVTPGETLFIYVGGRGGDLAGSNTAGAGGFNGGGTGGIDNVDFNGPAGGGGGVSDIRQGGDSLAHRVVVAAGGGGAECCTNGEQGGPAVGGNGGGTIGAFGGTVGGGSAPGGGGTQSSGGAGGAGCNGDGSSGSLGQGGVGGNGNRAGGGGGGGYYGGGGGGGCLFGSGGGGGSSYSGGEGTIHTQGYQTGAGQVIITVASAGVPAPTGLSATVGNEFVNLNWDPSPMNIDSYNVLRDESTLPNVTINLVTTNVPGTPQTFLASNLVNQQLYRFRVTAVKNGVESPPSDFVLARPGEFAVSQPPAHPPDRILFLHGIASDATTWDATKRFLEKTLDWKFGGILSYPDDVDPATRFPDESAGFDAKADFFTVNFGSSVFGNFFGGAVANYDVGRPGILHQADAVRGFTRRLTGGLQGKITIVAHSMGGLAARSYIADNADEAMQRVSQLTTYGTPHWGVSPGNVLENLGLLFFANPFIDKRGAQDLRVDCTNGVLGGPLDYSQEPSPQVFLDRLRTITLPDKIQYFAIRGHNDSSHQFLTPCLSRHWDGLVTIDSADLGTIPQFAPANPSPPPPLTTSSVPLLTTSRVHKDQQTSDFSAILCSLDLNCFIFNGRSPVNIEITAPDGRSVARQLSEIPGASYMELADANGHPIATVLIPFALGGEYMIEVLPKPGASPTDTYTLEVTRAGVTTVIAQDQRVEDIPAQPYIVTVLPPLNIDIKPGSSATTINTKSQGKTPVAILSTSSFNAPAQVDAISLTFGRTGNETSLAFCSGPEDVNGDGLPDLVCHFSIQQAAFLVGDTQGVLKGKTVDGIPFVGTDSVRVIP